MEKSSGDFYRTKPASFDEHVERAIVEHLRRKYQSIEAAALDLEGTEKTARNWRDMGPPRGVVRALRFLKKHPELRHAIFDEWAEA